ncbi:hypothetical protein Bca4012_029624 [Brassica carinata]
MRQRIHKRLMNFVMLQELMKQLTNFKRYLLAKLLNSNSSFCSHIVCLCILLGGVFYLNWDVLLSKAWRRGAEVQSPKTRDGITTNENGDHDYVEYNNSSTTSTCQDHSPWLSA